MSPNEIELTTKQNIAVIFKFIKHIVPWEYVVAVILGIIISFYYVPATDMGVKYVLAPILTGTVGVLIVMLGKLIPLMFKIAVEELKPTFLKFKEEAQKDAIDKVDDQLLK